MAAVDPEQADRFRFDGLKLPVQELAADFHLVRLRRAILRRPALHHVADVDVGAFDRNAFLGRRAFDHLREQLARAADEREPLRVFIGAGAFADKHQSRLLVARSENDLVARFVQAAARAVADVGDNLEQRILRRFDGRQHGNRDGSLEIGAGRHLHSCG